MDNPQISQSFYLSLVKFLLLSKQEIISSSAELGLSSMQAFTVLLTDNAHPQSMNTFGKLYNCDASNVTGIIDGLEQKGLAMRENHPNDRRIKVIHLTPAGQELQAKIIRKLAVACDFLFNPLDHAEAKQFAASIEKIARSMSS